MASGNILIADDDTAIRTVLSQALSRAGYDVRATGTAATLWRWVQSGDGDLVITDVVMPDENAFELLPKMKRLRPDLPIIVMSAQNTFMTAIKASERGAYDYLPKPFDLRELVSIVGRAMSEPKNRVKVERNEELEGMPLVGRSPAMQEIYRALARLMQTDLTVMITGESGTGKELVARALHDYGKRKKVLSSPLTWPPFRAISSKANCSGTRKAPLPAPISVRPDVSNKRRGARSSSMKSATCPWRRRPGFCACSSKANTRRSAAGCRSRTNVRIIAATNKDLLALIQQGLFREDLFFRLNVVPLRLPPLRERTEDIGDLAQHFFALAASEGLPLKRIEPDALDRLKRYRWPGNIRELENLTRRLAALYPQEAVTVQLIDTELPVDAPALASGFSPASNAVRPQEPERAITLASAMERHLTELFRGHGDNLPPPGLYHRILRELEYPLISAALAATRGNQIKAAELLGAEPEYSAQESSRSRHQADALAAIGFAQRSAPDLIGLIRADKHERRRLEMAATGFWPWKMSQSCNTVAERQLDSLIY